VFLAIDEEDLGAGLNKSSTPERQEVVRSPEGEEF
jgi:hypothetical protein